MRAGTQLDKEECLKVPDLEAPDQSEECVVDCEIPGCVLGQWGSWSSCSQGCPSTRTRKRPGSDKCLSSAGEALITETENCPCMKYRSVPNSGQWSRCILETSSETSEFCGIGKRYRRLDCLDSNNQLVDIK